MLVYFLFEICTLLVLGLLLLFKKERNGHCAKIMGVAILDFVIMTLRFMEPYLFSAPHWNFFGYMDLFLRFGSLMCNPLLIIYYILLTTGKIRRWQYGIVFGPSLLLWLVIVVAYFSMSQNEQRSYFYSQFLTVCELPSTSAVRFYDAVCGLWYLGMIRIYSLSLYVYCLHLLFVYEKRLKNYFSDTTGKGVDLDKAALFIIMFFIICLLVQTFDESIMSLAQAIGMYRITASIGNLLPLLFFWLAAYRCRYSAVDFVIDANDSSILNRKYLALCPLGPEELSLLEDRLLKVVSNGKLYLKPNLTIDDVAHELHADSKCVLKCINRKNGLTFYHFIQLYRVKYAYDFMSANPNVSFAQVAQISGFANEKSFHKAYKYAGYSIPLAYRKRIG